MIVKNQSLLIAFDTDNQTVAGAIVTQDVYDDDGQPLTTRTKPLSEVELAETLASIDAALLAERDDLASQLAIVIAERDELQTKLAELKPPHDPRKIDPAAWYARFTRDEVIAIALRGATDVVVQSILANLDASIALRKSDVTYQMSLDHPNAIQGVGYLVQIGILSQDRAAELLSDSREDEV